MFKNEIQWAKEVARLVEPVVAIATQAGQAIVDVYYGKRSAYNVTHKADLSPVTAADWAAHEVLSVGLASLTPDCPILSEEEKAPPFSERSQWDTYWLIDPLDGTREFIKRNDEFTVNISLIYQQRPILGVIYVPVTQSVYFAYRNGGAFRRTPGAMAERIRSRPWDGAHIVVAGSRSRYTPVFDAFLAGFASYEALSVGSSLKSCLVAEGTADIYARFGPTSEWDTAAAQCIVEEAGGAVLSLDMKPLRYNHSPSLINPSFIVVGDPCHDWASYLPELVA